MVVQSVWRVNSLVDFFPNKASLFDLLWFNFKMPATFAILICITFYPFVSNNVRSGLKNIEISISIIFFSSLQNMIKRIRNLPQNVTIIFTLHAFWNGWKEVRPVLFVIRLALTCYFLYCNWMR